MVLSLACSTESGSLAVTFRTRVQQHALGSSNPLRIQIDSRTLQSVVEARCEGGLLLDNFGRHRAAPAFWKAAESSGDREPWKKVCSEAGATVRCNAKLREMNMKVAAIDEREIEVLFSLHHSPWTSQ